MSANTPQPLILVGLNEINFDFVAHYTAKGELPNLAALMRSHGVQETLSEDTYERLEPWIQWVSIQTGKTFDEHKVFRLGDIVHTAERQYWEVLEEKGFKVAAVSPMNAANRLSNSSFFIPDAWTETRASGSPRADKLARAVAHVVNRNADQPIEPGQLLTLLTELLRLGGVSEWRALLAAASPSARRWRLAMLLDRLLALEFLDIWRKVRPDFATLFLNAGAHIQHHYMFASSAYSGSAANPSWYLKPGYDPVFEVLQLYDHVVGRVTRAIPQARLVLATGLHQDPHPRVTYYWRLKDHAGFLQKLGLSFRRVLPRMSRDFLVECDSHEQAVAVKAGLDACRSEDGQPLFEGEVKESSVFVSLVYDRDVPAGASFRHPGGVIPNARDLVGFVAIKNGEHNGVGYVIDTAAKAGNTSRIPVASLFDRVLQHFGLGDALPGKT